MVWAWVILGIFAYLAIGAFIAGIMGETDGGRCGLVICLYPLIAPYALGLIINGWLSK